MAEGTDETEEMEGMDEADEADEAESSSVVMPLINPGEAQPTNSCVIWLL
jgi:hypothetical protein